MGIMVNVNYVFDLHELNVYDPALPTSYFRSCSAATGQRSRLDPMNFCPLVTSMAIARRYGVWFVLEPHLSPAPYLGIRFRRLPRLRSALSYPMSGSLYPHNYQTVPWSSSFELHRKTGCSHTSVPSKLAHCHYFRYSASAQIAIYLSTVVAWLYRWKAASP